MTVLYLFFLTALMVVSTTAPAHAYLDPGTMSMIMQAVAAAVVSATVVLRMYWSRFRIFLTRLIDGLKKGRQA